MAAGELSAQKCTAHKKNGIQCGAYAIKGSTVCRVHGGGAPQVKRAAQARIDMAAIKMVGVQVEIALDESVEARDRIVAAREILNRSSEVNQPNATLKVTGEVGPSPVLEAIVRAAQERVRNMPESKFKGKVFGLDNAVDAEVVDDD